MIIDCPKVGLIMNVQALSKLGKDLGLSGPQLKGWIETEQQREAELKESEHKRIKEIQEGEREKLKIEQSLAVAKQAEAEKRLLLIEKETELLQLRRENHDNESNTSVTSNTTSVGTLPKTPKMLVFDENKDKILDFLNRFERVYKINNGPKEDMATILSTLLLKFLD